MADKNIFKLEGKSQEQVKEAFLEFLKIDKTKPGGYASVGSNKVICKVAKEACGGKLGIGNQESRGCYRSEQTPDWQNRRRIGLRQEAPNDKPEMPRKKIHRISELLRRSERQTCLRV